MHAAYCSSGGKRISVTSAPKPARHRRGVFDARRHFVIGDRVMGVKMPDQADFKALHPTFQIGEVIVDGPRRSPGRPDRVRRWPPGPARCLQRYGLKGRHYRARRKRDDPASAHPTIGRFDADDPQHEAGLRTLPPVSLPSAAGTIPAATLVPAPDEEPPG